MLKVPARAPSTVCCLFPVHWNVIHQYTSTQPHPVKDNLNVNILQVLFKKKSPQFVFPFVPDLI